MRSAWEASEISMSIFNVLFPDLPEVNLAQVLGAYCTDFNLESEMPVMSIIRFRAVVFRPRIHKAQYDLSTTTGAPYVNVTAAIIQYWSFFYVKGNTATI